MLGDRLYSGVCVYERTEKKQLVWFLINRNLTMKIHQSMCNHNSECVYESVSFP